MSDFSLDEFKSSVIDVVRTNKFYVIFATTPKDIDIDNSVKYQIKEANVPAISVGVSEDYVGWFGKRIKMMGDKHYEDLSITFINIVDSDLIDQFDKWLNMSVVEECTILIIQLDNDGLEYNTHIINCYPFNRSELSLSHDSYDTTQEFSVQFTVQNMILE